MFHIGRKPVHDGAEKIITLYYAVYVELETFSFTFNDAENYATSEKWQKIFIFSLNIALITSVNVAQWFSTKYKASIPGSAGSIPTCVIHFSGGMARQT